MPVPHSTAAVQEVHLVQGLPVSLLYCQIPAVCSRVVVALTVRHYPQNSIVQGPAFAFEGGVAAA